MGVAVVRATGCVFAGVLGIENNPTPTGCVRVCFSVTVMLYICNEKPVLCELIVCLHARSCRICIFVVDHFQVISKLLYRSRYPVFVVKQYNYLHFTPCLPRI